MAKRERNSVPTSDIVPVTAGDFARFLAEKGGDDEICPVCNHPDWDILCPGGADSMSMRIGVPVRNMNPSFYISMFSYCCKSCGYMRFHSAHVVYRWVIENPSIDADRVDWADEQEDVTDE